MMECPKFCYRYVAQPLRYKRDEFNFGFLDTQYVFSSFYRIQRGICFSLLQSKKGKKQSRGNLFQQKFIWLPNVKKDTLSVCMATDPLTMVYR